MPMGRCIPLRAYLDIETTGLNRYQYELTVVGVLIEVPVMLVCTCLRARNHFSVRAGRHSAERSLPLAYAANPPIFTWDKNYI